MEEGNKKIAPLVVFAIIKGFVSLLAPYQTFFFLISSFLLQGNALALRHGSLSPRTSTLYCQKYCCFEHY